jgi:2-methylcitrate dehydratase
MSRKKRVEGDGVTRRSFLRSTASVGAGAVSVAAMGLPASAQAPRAPAAPSGGAQAPIQVAAPTDDAHTLSRTLSQYAINLSYADFSPEVIRYGKHLLLDTIGVALGAYTSTPSQITRDVIDELGGRPEATIIGSGKKTSASLAALANGCMVRYLDFMDVYFNVDGPHPSENIPTALAMAERQHANGRQLFEAMFIGFELQGRFADAWSFPRMGFHHVTIGGYITPIIAGKLLNLTEDQMVNAVGLGGTTSHTTSYLGDQVTMIKALGYPFTAQRGIEAALMAQKGMTGPANAFETYMRVVKFDGDMTPVIKGGTDARILHTAIKPYAAEYMSHSPLEALFDMLKATPLKAEDVESISLQTFSTAMRVLARPSAWKPETRETADHSLPYCLAVGLIEGELSAPQFAREQWKDPKVIALMSKISITEDPALTKLYPPARPADLTIRTKDGRVLRKRVDYPKGDPHNPMSDDEVKGKFRKLVKPLMNEARMTAIIDCVDHIEHLKDTAQLMKLLAV